MFAIKTCPNRQRVICDKNVPTVLPFASWPFVFIVLRFCRRIRDWLGGTRLRVGLVRDDAHG